MATTGEDDPTEPKTARVSFTWTSISGYPYEDVTLLSAFQSVELYVAQQSTKCQYASDEVTVPVGQYEGQLVIGSSFCFPVKEFKIEEDGALISLELDISKMDSDYNTDPTNTTANATATSTSGTYNQYVSAYSTSDPPLMHMNPAYKGHHHDDDDLFGETTGLAGQRLLMIFTPPFGDDESAVQPNDILFSTKKMQDQSTHHSTSGDHTQPVLSSSDHLEEKFSRQLSREGFTPATVKSKKSNTTSSTITSNSTIRYSPDPSSQTTPTPTTTEAHTIPDKTSNKTSKKSTTLKQTTTSSPKTEEPRFLVSQITGTSSKDSHPVSMEEHASVCEERDRLKRNYERVTAQLEGRLRELQKKLSKYEVDEEHDEQPLDNEDKLDQELEDLRKENDEIRTELELNGKKLAEAQDRITALENQIGEYAGTIEDQSRIIHNYTHHGGGDLQYKKLTEMFNTMSQFTKKQQAEFAMIVNSTQKEMERFTQLEQDNAVLKQACEELTTEVTQRRSQAKQLMKDIEDLRMERQTMKEKLQKIAHQKQQPSTMESLELETLRQKCRGWKESAERALDDQEAMKVHVQQLEQELESLKQESKDKLHVEKEAGAVKVSDLQKKVKELQDIRIKMEEEMSKLRSEKTNLVSRNAELATLCDPNETKKMKQEFEEEKELLEKELKDMHVLLESHQQKNLDLKDQLEKASNSEILDVIQEKMGRYKRERDGLKKHIVSLEEQHGIQLEQLREEIDTLQAKKKRYRMSYKILEERYEELLKQNQVIQSGYTGIHGNSQDQEIDGGSPHDIPSVSGIGTCTYSSTQSLPVDIVDSTSKRKSKSGIVLTSSSKANPAHRSLLETTPNEYIPSLNSSEEVKLIQIHTKNGVKEAYVQKLDQDALSEGIPVVVLRSNGHYEEGVVKYYGHPSSGDLVIGIQLELPRTELTKHHSHDGTYKDGQQYFKCNPGHGMYVSLSKVFLKIDIS